MRITAGFPPMFGRNVLSYLVTNESNKSVTLSFLTYLNFDMIIWLYHGRDKHLLRQLCFEYFYREHIFTFIKDVFGLILVRILVEERYDGLLLYGTSNY